MILGFAGAWWAISKVVTPIVSFFESGGSNIQIQSGGGVSISTKNGNVTIKGKVKSVTVNGRKIYAP